VRSSRRVPLKRLMQISTSNHIDRRAVPTAGGHVVKALLVQEVFLTCEVGHEISLAVDS
jgi:hypothetical protein